MMWGNGFRIKKAFGRVRRDMTALNSDILALKANTHEWITYLNAENKELRIKNAELEMRLRQLEKVMIK